jgi:hypothetical protein
MANLSDYISEDVKNMKSAIKEEKEIYIFSSSIMSNENEGLIFHSKDDALEYFKDQKKYEVERFESGKSDCYETSTVVAKTIPASDLDKYKEGTLGEFNKPYSQIANSFNDYEKVRNNSLNQEQQSNPAASKQQSDPEQKGEKPKISFDR